MPLPMPFEPPVTMTERPFRDADTWQTPLNRERRRKRDASRSGSILLVGAGIDEASDPLVFRGVCPLQVERTDHADQHHRKVNPWDPIGEAQSAAEEVEVRPQEIDDVDLREEG